MTEVYITDEEGVILVKEARRIVKDYLTRLKKSSSEIPSNLQKKLRVFVTIEKYPSLELRGCIGFPKPSLNLKEGIVEAAISAAIRDPRFVPMQAPELDHVIFEVSVLTPPVKINYKTKKELLDAVVVGKHGLIASKGSHEGLLLPQVPVDQGWNPEQFLMHTCNKAGIPHKLWDSGNITYQRFTGIVFTEITPDGIIKRKALEIKNPGR